MMSVHVNNNCAKVAHFLLTVREVLAAEGVDMVLGDLNGTANIKLSALPTSGVKGQAIPDLDKFELGLSSKYSSARYFVHIHMCHAVAPYGARACRGSKRRPRSRTTVALE